MIVDRSSSGLSGYEADLLFGADPSTLTSDPPPEVADRAINMTGEQFVWHVRAMMNGLLYLKRTLERWIEQYPVGGLSYDQVQALREFLGLPLQGDTPSAGWTLGVARMRDVIAFIDDQIAATGRILGDDWQVVFIDHKNVLALGYRMGRKDTALLKAWYNATAATLEYGFAILKSDLDYRYDIAMSIQAHWSRMRALAAAPIAIFAAIVQTAADWAAAAASAVGGALGAVGEGIVSGIWKAVKPLILPVALLGTVTLGGMYLWRKHGDKFLPKEDMEKMAKEAIKVAPMVAGLGRRFR